MARTVPVVAQHELSGMCFWSGMEFTGNTPVTWINHLRCIQSGCDKLIEGYVDRSGETPRLRLFHKDIKGRIADEHVSHFSKMPLIMAKLKSFKLSNRRCRKCNRPFQIWHPYRRALITKNRAGVVAKSFIGGKWTGLWIKLNRNAEHNVSEERMPRGDIIDVHADDFINAPDTVHSIQGVTKFIWCVYHKTRVSYPAVIFHAKCPDCGRNHDPLRISSSSYECSYAGSTLKKPYLMWNLSRTTGDVSPYFQRQFIKPLKRKPKTYRKLYIITSASQDEVDASFRCPVIKVNHEQEREHPGSVFLKDTLDVRLCPECDQRRKQKQPCCPVCSIPGCLSCKEPPFVAKIPPSFQGEPGRFEQCFNCGWIDDGGTMAKSKHKVQFPYNREGIKGTLYLCKNCYQPCIRCNRPAKDELCVRCEKSRQKQLNLALVHTNAEHMKITEPPII